jgi:hypothetical protein
VVLGGIVTFVENAASLRLAATAAVTDTDNPDFNGGSLTVTITNNADVNDRLQVVQQGTGPGQISFSGSNVAFSGATIGTFTGGNGSTPLVVTFNSSAATAAAAQALVRDIRFRTNGDNPATADRKIKFVLNDGDGFSSNPAKATKTVKVTAVNDAPVLSGGGTIGYKLNAMRVVLLASAALTDPDSPDFNLGSLKVHYTAGSNASNLLGLSDPFSVDGSNNVKFGTTTIGTRTQSGVGTSDLVITFNGSATPTIVRDLIRSITFKATSSTAQRILTFSVTDGDTGTSNTITKTINVTA